MADQKISQLTDGTSFQAGDEAVVNRSGTNYKVDPTQFGSSIDVTGTVTADGLVVDAGGNSAILIQNANPGLVFDDNSAIGAGSDKFIIRSVAAQSLGDYELVMNNDQTSSSDVTVAKFAGNGDISFYEDTGTTPKFFWDASAEALGIGTTSPEGQLELERQSNANYAGTFSFQGAALQITDSSNVTTYPTASAQMQFKVGNTGIAESYIAGLRESANSGALAFGTQDGAVRAERMRIDYTGNVGIGTTSPSQALDVVGNIEVSGGVYLGGTGAANLLDDYETGTWTPVIVGGTTAGTGIYTTQEGIYTKVGDLVTVTCWLDWSAHTGTGMFLVTGLPFSASAAINLQAGSTYASNFDAGTSATQLIAYVSGSTSISFRGFVNNAARAVTNINLSGTLGVTISYRVA